MSEIDRHRLPLQSQLLRLRKNQRSGLSCQSREPLLKEGLTTVAAFLLATIIPMGHAAQPVAEARTAFDVERTWKYIPDPVDVVLWIDLDSLRRAAQFPELRASVDDGLDELSDRFAKALGIQLEDVSTIVYAETLRKPSVGASVLCATKPFQLADKTPAQNSGATSLKLLSRKVGDRTVYFYDQENADELCLLDDCTLLVTTAGAMQQVLKREDANPPEFFNCISPHLNFAATFVVAGRPGRLAEQQAMKPPILLASQSVECFGIEIEVDRSLHIKVTFESYTEEGAELNGDSIRAIAEALADPEGAPLSEDEILRQLAAATRVTSKGKFVTVQLDATAAQWTHVWRTYLVPRIESTSDDPASDGHGPAMHPPSGGPR